VGAMNASQVSKGGSDMTPMRVVLAAFILVAGCAPGSTPSSSSAAGTPTARPAPTTGTPSQAHDVSPSPTARVDYAEVPGRLLVQHFGNALDGSEVDPGNLHSERARFYLMKPDGTGLKELLPGQPASGKNMADVSRDGTRVVFQDWPATAAPRIYEVNLDGTGFRMISTPCGCLEGDPAYSPDAKRIAFVRQVGNEARIGIRDLASGKVTILARTVGIDSGTGSDLPEQPAWSPDSRSIVYAMMRRTDDGRLMSSRIEIIDLATMVVTELPIPAALSVGEPKFSPDGSLLLLASRPAYATIGAAFGDVYTVHPDGTALTLLTPDEGTGASWTPDGKHILYYAENYIWLMDPDGKNKAQWSHSGPDLSTTERGYGYTTYWIPARE